LARKREKTGLCPVSPERFGVYYQPKLISVFQVTRLMLSGILSIMESESVETLLGDELPIPSDLTDGTDDVALSPPQANLWALVLESRGIPCTIKPEGNVWCLFVPHDSFHAALNELRLFEEENRDWPPRAAARAPMEENTLATIFVLLLLAAFHNLTRLDFSHLGHYPSDWISLGSADSAKILDGQWWRLVTALTLHSGWLHLLGNLVIGGIFIIFVCRYLGTGLAWLLLLGTGVLGNLANAFFQEPSHISIGASTAVFGAIGILTSLNLLRHRRYLRRRWPLHLGAALSLLTMLGTEGVHTDLGAHLFGFLSGTVLGLVAGYLVGAYGRPGRVVDVLLSLVSVIAVVSAWWAALSY
jgi:membrane associated rhomboid family serine protease